ncbi:MAG TPA: 30S ribosomal protein S14 [Gemmatales bacterium]|nr:30S ribosomal protein S14 [Gemmatales bacterium]HMP15619.1 30S ribosomal protein S14 [Gemmatales bacterium]
MAVTAKLAKFKREQKAIEEQKKNPDKKVLRPRDRIRIRLRCKICGRPRGVYRKFGICRICLRKYGSDGLIPGLKKASW